LGGTYDDFGYGVAVDSVGNAYVIGQTSSSDFPVAGALQPTLAGGSDAFLAKIQPGITPSLVAELVGSNLQLKWPAFPPGYVLETSPSFAIGATWTVVLQSPATVNGWYNVTLPANAAAAFFRLHRP
jgi:hypothetical protein